MSTFAQVGDLCPNTVCTDHGKSKTTSTRLAAGLTDHIWTVEALLKTVILPNNI